MLDHQWDVAALLDRLDDPRIGHSRRRALLDELREVLTLWWQTDELRRIRPRVEDEVRRNLFFFEAVLFDAVPAVLGEIEHALAVRLVQPVLTLRLAGPAATWTATPRSAPTRSRRALSLHRTTALRLFRDPRRPAGARCSATRRCGSRSPRSCWSRWSTTPRSCRAPPCLRRPHREWEPLRTKLGFVHHRLGNTLTPRGREPGYADAQAMRRDLELVLAHLNSRHVAMGTSGACCGRSTSSASTWRGSTSARARARARGDRRDPARLRRRRRAAPPGAADRGAGQRPARDRARSRRRGGRAAARARHRRAERRRLRPAGRAGVRDLDDRAPSDVLAATWLAHARGRDLAADGAAVRDARRARAGAGDDGRALRLRALRRPPAHAGQPPDGDGRLQRLRQGHGLHRLHLGAAQRAGAAGQAGRRARTSCSSSSTAAAARRRAAAGAPIARSWPSPRAPSTGASASPSRARRSRPATPTPELAERSLEQTISAVLLASALPNPPVRDEWRAEMERLSERSRERYRALVYDDPEFMRFFGQAAPIAELSQLNIGSRPPSRKGAAGVESLRAIPWVFAWTQNRLLLPSWYGAGTALAAGDLELQREMWRDWPFFRGLIGTLEMALFKSDLGVAERYLSLVDEDIAQRFWTDLVEEYDSVVERVLTVTHQGRLLDETPALQRRLEHRNPWIDPLSHLQVELLRRVRSGREEARPALLATITGIAAGMRNTG